VEDENSVDEESSTTNPPRETSPEMATSDPKEGKKQGMSKEQRKFWSDLWEAWCGALFLERQLWNESKTDLEKTLAFLIERKYAPLTLELSSGLWKVNFNVMCFSSRSGSNSSSLSSRSWRYSEDDV
jgi:hypothetical protein